MNLDVSIILVNYKTKDLTINAIKSIKEKTIDIKYEILVVDNNSEDGSVEVIKQIFPDVNVISNSSNLGFGTANNVAIKEAKGKYIFCLNTDTLLLNNAIKLMYNYMEKNLNVGVCGGYIYDSEMKPGIAGGMFPSYPQVLLKFDFANLFKRLKRCYNLSIKSDDEYINNIDYISGANLFVRKTVFNTVGYFDEKIFLYFEETDLCKRIKNSGYEVKFLSEAKIVHLEGKSISSKDGYKKFMCKDSELYYLKKHYVNSFNILRGVYLLLYILDWLILGNKSSKDMFFFVLKWRQGDKN